jgi:hypothetical protein
VALQLSPLRHFATISGRHRVAHNHEGTPVDKSGGKSPLDALLHVVAPRVWALGILPLQVCDRTVYANGHSFRLALAIQQPTVGS